MSLATVIPASLLATGVYNLDSSRFRSAPLDKRKEAWTESWGDPKRKNETSWKIDEESISLLLATPHPQLPLILTQYRPAWLEQVVLRMAKIPHIVLNAHHLSNEATGPLPYLRDHQPSKPPILVGRYHPSNIAPDSVPCQNSILDYLLSERKVNFDSDLLTDQERSLSSCYLNLINGELQNILLYLRYEDHDAWEQVYRRQYLRACSSGSDNWFLHLKGRFQASMERVTALRNLQEYRRKMTVPQAVARAKEAYQALEYQLSSHEKLYLLGKDKPSLVDAVLWSHLADALCDVHLVIELASFPRLVKYFQKILKTYFPGNQDAWDEWNHKQNINNAFQQIPIYGKSKLEKSAFKNAIELMQTLSLRNENLPEVLETAKAKRAEEPWPVPPKATASVLYRWRMGDDFQNPKEIPEAEENPSRKKMQRDQERNDQAWVSGVAGVSVAALLLLQATSTKERK